MREGLSVGVLYSCRELLRYVEKEKLAARDLHQFFATFYVAESRIVSHLSQQCNWIEISHEGQIEITEAGRAVAARSPEAALRLQLQDYILGLRPPWSALIPRGREEASAYFPVDVRQCFDEAQLLGELDDEVVGWWDNLANAARGQTRDCLSAIGRRGERLSVLFERQRTGCEPEWVAVESNLAGFDIQSRVSGPDPTDLFIEVKASEKNREHASLYISENEWRVANSCRNYVFHVWVGLALDAALYVVSRETIARHVPKNCGDGQWQNIRLPADSITDGAEEHMKIDELLGNAG